MEFCALEFTLHYRGDLKSNAGAVDKHHIRQRLHPQLKELWTQPPLSHFAELLSLHPEFGFTILCDLGPFKFAPLFSCKLNFLAEVEITLLRPGIPGDIVQHGGDIDNRLKTLLDALSMPSQLTALPPGIQPVDGETPFFCVLEDDRLITKLSVHTDRLLEPVNSPSEVELTLLIRTKKLVKIRGIAGLDDI
jgi:hypothetical protein